MQRRLGAVTIAIVLLGIVWWRSTDVGTAANVALAAGQSAGDAATTPPPARAHPSRSPPSDADFGEAPPVDPGRMRCLDDRRRQFQARREQLRPHDTPDAAIEHALLTTLLSLAQDVGPGAGSNEFRAARQRWPDNLELAWFSAQQCTDGARCDRDIEWRHLATLDPDNAAVWLMAMSQARQDEDEARYEQALQRAAAATYYDPRIGTTFRHARSLLGALPLPESCLSPAQVASMQATLGRPPGPQDWVGIGAMGLELAVAMPPVGGLTGCQPSRRFATARRQDCIVVLSRVAAGDTLLERTVALRVLIGLTGNGPGNAQLREQYRRLAWLTHAARTSRGFPEGEVAGLQARAIAEGRWPPPPDWLPDDARERALIRTGRVPAQ